MEVACNQLQSYSAVDVMINNPYPRFTDSIESEGCDTFRLFLEHTLATLQLMLAGVNSAAIIACNEPPVRCKQESPDGKLSVTLVFFFRIYAYYSTLKFLRFSTADSTRV